MSDGKKDSDKGLKKGDNRQRQEEEDSFCHVDFDDPFTSFRRTMDRRSLRERLS